MENMESLQLMICTFLMKKNVQQHLAMVSRLFLIQITCFVNVIIILTQKLPAKHADMCASNTNIHAMNTFFDNRIRPKLFL